MARTIEHRIGIVTIDDTQFVALSRYLPADADHAETRVKGGIYANASDAKALAHMRDLARKFADACDERLAALAKPKPAPKAPKAPVAPAPEPEPKAAESPKAPKPMCNDASHADNAQAGAKFCPLCGKDLTALARQNAVAKARASKPAKTSTPEPAKSAAFDWSDMIGQESA